MPAVGPSPLHAEPMSESPERQTANQVSPFVREAIRRMHAAPASFFTPEELMHLNAYDGPIVGGDPQGRVPEDLENHDNE